MHTIYRRRPSKGLLGEAQHDPAVAALNERLIRPQTEKTVASLKAAQERGQTSADFASATARMNPPQPRR